MKINKFKKYQSLAFATTLSILTGCSYTGNTVEPSEMIIEENSIVLEQPKAEEENFQMVSAADIITVHRSVLELTLTPNIAGNIPDAFYQQTNNILQNQNITTISLCEIGDEIDFTKLDFSNIKNINIIHCKESLQCNNLIRKYDMINFVNSPISVVTNFLNNGNYSDTSIIFQNIVDIGYDSNSFMDIDALAQFLIENPIYIKKLGIYQNAYPESAIPLTSETIEKICQVNAKEITINSIGNTEAIDLDLNLNESIESLIFTMPSEVEKWGIATVNGELGNIIIEGTKPILVSFKNTDITENTSFHLPENCIVNIEDCECRDVEPLYDFRTADIVIYYPSSTDYDSSPYSISYNAYRLDADEQNFDKFIEKVNQMQQEKVKCYQ